MKKSQQQQPTLFDTELAKGDTKQPVCETKAVLPDDWYLTRWVEFAIPAWRKVLKESIEAGDKRREQYARHILKDVLEVKDA
jgi:hypothetical protein